MTMRNPTIWRVTVLLIPTDRRNLPVSKFVALMDIGSDAWMRNIRLMIQETEEILSVEGTVISQRASELQIEASKVC